MADEHEILVGKCSECGEPTISRLPVVTLRDVELGFRHVSVEPAEIVGCEHVKAFLEAVVDG